MTENDDQKPRFTLLTAIASAFSVWVASAVIIGIIGYGTTAALSIALIIAVAVFGAFLFKIYFTDKKTRLPVVTPSDQHCLILSAPTHGVLQDRMNYWLRGGYGKVTSSSMAATEKGFYITIFYDDVSQVTKEIKELPEVLQDLYPEGESNEKRKKPMAAAASASPEPKAWVQKLSGQSKVSEL
jgi:hypothetical protein